jgi:hypothetical protein
VQTGPALAESDDDVKARLEALEAKVAEQEKVIQRQQQILSDNSYELQRVKAAMVDYMLPGGNGTVTISDRITESNQLDHLRATGQSGPRPGEEGVEGVQKAAAENGTETVGEKPEEKRPEVAALADEGGVLTPAGTLVIEPSLQFSTSETDRFFFRGIEIIDTVLIGIIDASQVSRETVEAAVTGRIGITDRVEAFAKVPFVYRSDDFRGLTIGDAEFGDRSVDGKGLGDIEFGANAQLTNGPIYVIANARVKTDTGKGPFDVDRDAMGVEKDLATGSGFWSLEPSFTFIAPSDPVVFFANLGYSFNIGKDVNEDVDGDTTIEHVDPGDVLKGVIGMGIAFNQSASMSISYEHNYIFPTKTDLIREGEPISATSDHAHVGLMGVSGTYRFNENISLTGQVQFGITEDAPDMRATVRVPITLQGLFD